ncbi:MAG: hypothetical protein U0M06_03175, partial [Clostridia bacterium]|nr:hypothetical protein [Clostridia bacterium]
ELQNITEIFCDEYCKYPCEIKDVGELEKVWGECPMNKLLDLITPPKILTEFDRIKNMNIEQLAEFLYSAPDKICFENCTKDTGNKFSCKFGEGVDVANCINCMKEYLLREVKI